MTLDAHLFFERPILNSPYECPKRHWELDEHGQPTQRILDSRRRAQFITPIPKPTERKSPKAQAEIFFDEGKGRTTKAMRATFITTASQAGARLEDGQRVGHADPTTTNLYGRRGYNPEKSASFFANYQTMPAMASPMPILLAVSGAKTIASRPWVDHLCPKGAI